MSPVHSDGWIGVDLDGTLASYDQWLGVEHIGEPVILMADRVRTWLRQGRNVRIFTARVSRASKGWQEALRAIEAWCVVHFGQVLPVTCEKDLSMIELWDDRCVAVEKNTGIQLSPSRVHS